ncbi:MAG: dihydroneopterin aldolase [Ginsengibacter sp.]
MITVYLHDLLFTAYHGIHEEEKILGNEYVVNCSVDFDEKTEVIELINDTVNYASIYEMIKNRMKIATPLLETVVMEIGDQICKEYPEIKSIEVAIKKLHPPLTGIQGAAGVSWKKQF